MNATALQIGSSLSRSAAMPFGRLTRAYLTEAKYETLRMLRTPGFAIPFLGLPAALYLLFAVVIFGAALRNDPQGAMFVFAGFSVFGIMGPGMFGFGMIVAIEREQGLVQLKRALPMPPAAYLLAKLIMSVLFGAMVMVTMLAAAMSLGHLPFTMGQALSVAAVCTLGTSPFCAIGLYLGTRLNSRSAPAIVNLVYQLMMHLSGLFYPLPRFLQSIAPIWPSYHLRQLVFIAVGSTQSGGAMEHVAFLAGLTVLLVALALRRLARVG
jgi:ABC-2 type transport system permease protein